MSVCLSVTVTSVLSSGSSAGSCRVRSASRCLSVCHCDVCPVVRFVGRFMSRKERLEMSVCHCDICPVVRFVGSYIIATVTVILSAEELNETKLRHTVAVESYERPARVGRSTAAGETAKIQVTKK